MGSRIVRALLLTAGLLCLGLGMAGIALPVLPATPFIMLAAFCFARSSQRLDRWLHSKKLIARRLESLEQGRGLSARDKAGIFALATVLILPVILVSGSMHLRIFLASLLVTKAVFFILWNPQKKRRAQQRNRADTWGSTILAALGMVQSLGNVLLYALIARILVDRGLRADPWLYAGLGGLGMKLLSALGIRLLMPRVSATERRRLRAFVMDAAWTILDRKRIVDTGKITSLATEGVESLTLYRGLYVPQMVVGVVTPLLIVGTIALADGFTALVLLGLIPLTPLMVGGLQRQFRTASAAYREVNGRLIHRYEEGLLGLATLKAAGQSSGFGERIDQAAAEHRTAAMGLLLVNQLLILFLDLSASLGLTFMSTWLAWQRFTQGHIGPFAAVFIVLASLELIRPQQLMGAFFFAGGLGRNTLKAVSQLREEAGETAGQAGVEAPRRIDQSGGDARELVAADLGYRYPGSDHRTLPLRVRLVRGRLLGLLGTSGSGKTTLCRILCGALEAQGGSIVVDGRDLTRDPAALRRMVAVADQHPYLFSGTVGQNLRYSKPSATDQELWKALEAVDLHRIPAIRTQGLDAPVGEEGRLLSGGQRSRLSLARALLKDSPFLILDEPSADLDPGTEALALRLAQDLSRDRGVLVISHRPALLAGTHERIAMPVLEEACPG